MNFQQIRYFLTLAKELHFWKTAEKVNITQSALSRQIQSLENELGIRLFERDKRNVKLTPAGRFLKEKWQMELSELEFIHQFARQIHLGESGIIRIAHPDSISTVVMPELLKNITSKFPKLQIELVQIAYENQLDFLRNYKIDVSITREQNQVPQIGTAKLLTDNLCVVVPEKHPFRTRKDMTKKMLAQQKFILPSSNRASSYNDIILKVFDYFDITPETQIHSEFGSTIMALVRKNFGIAILPESFEHHQTPGLRFISLPIKSPLYINWREDDHNPVLSNVLKLILQSIKQ